MGVLAHVVPKTPPRKMCQKPHPEKNRKKPVLTGKSQQPPPENSQGQECQECQGQIPRSRMSGMPRSNPKVKNVRNAKVKSQGQECQECQGQIPRSRMSGMPRSNFPRSNGKPQKNRKKPVLTGKNRKNGKWKNGKV